LPQQAHQYGRAGPPYGCLHIGEALTAQERIFEGMAAALDVVASDLGMCVSALLADTAFFDPRLHMRHQCRRHHPPVGSMMCWIAGRAGKGRARSKA
jgi:hypothetical protein